MNPKKPIINCHTHIFTGDHVPPYLAKTFLPWPFFLLLRLSFIVALFRFWYKYVNVLQYKTTFTKLRSYFYMIRIASKRTIAGNLLSFVLELFLTVHVFFIIYGWLSELSPAQNDFQSYVITVKEFLNKYKLLQIPEALSLQILFVIILLLLFKNGRNLIFFILKSIWKFLNIIPGQKSKDLIDRYLSIGRFAFHKRQSESYNDLKNQYPEGTQFIVLPMDMEYMEAGKLKKEFSYIDQMEDLRKIKEKRDTIHPFVFVDPRRIEEQKSSHNSQEEKYFDYEIINHKVVLKDCFIKRYIEEYDFSGFKIYPALGYYPFDEHLLPLWKYAADNGIPIMTHCIKGTIFFRGTKKKEWDRHPVFQQNGGNSKYENLLLDQVKNIDFCNNFTHPLNYLCLLEESLLKIVVNDAKDPKVKELFCNESGELISNLKELKICFAHFGGDEHWQKFMQTDRYQYTSEFVRNPDRGINFLYNADGKVSPGKLEQIWKFVDWYSIICSIILQNPKVYADLSYIIHNNEIFPLLKQTLDNSNLRKKILFGTDFYVVRNHKSEKNMLADTISNLGEKDFDQIARINPLLFLEQNSNPKTQIQ